MSKAKPEPVAGFDERVRCPDCGRALLLRFGSDGRGGLVETVEFCGCPGSRRRAGICRDCHHPVEGTVGKALRCAVHKAAAKRQQWRKHDRTHRAARRMKDKVRWRRMDAEARAARNARKRASYATPEGKAKKRAEHRRYALRHPDKILAQYERHSNANRPDRAEMKRRWAHENQTVHRGQAPACSGCGQPVEWDGRGRPRRKCRACDPVRYELAERRRRPVAA